MAKQKTPRAPEEPERFIIDENNPHFARLSHLDEDTELLIEQKVSELRHGMLMTPTVFSD